MTTLNIMTTAETIRQKQEKAIEALIRAEAETDRIRNEIRGCLSFDSQQCGYCGQIRPLWLENPYGVKMFKPCTCTDAQDKLKAFRLARDIVEQLTVEAQYYGSQLDIADKSIADFQIPERYAEVELTISLDGFSEEIVDTLLGYLYRFGHEEPENLVITGGTGTGKTRLASKIGKYVQIEYLKNVGMISAVKLMALLRDFDNQEHIKEVEQIASTIPLLIVDDVGVADTSTSWQKERLYSILNARYESQLPTIITTNLTLEGLERYLGEASYSRLCESGICIELTGKDRRKTS